MSRYSSQRRGSARQQYPSSQLHDLFPHFSDDKIKELEKRINYLSKECPTYSRPLAVPVSTRGVGLSSAELFTRVKAERKLPGVTITPQQLYRAQLAMVERVIANNRDQAILPGPWYDSYNFYPYMTVLTHIGVCFTTQRTGVLIKSIPSFEFEDVEYVPTFPKEIKDTEGRLIPMPEFVYFTNLRRTVEYLSDPATDREIRINFREKNPIPGAKWNDENDTLTNPDDVIPASYTPIDLRNDLTKVKHWINDVMLKHPNWCNWVNLDSLEPGNESIFVSSESQSLYLDGLETRGDVRKFWSSRHIPIDFLISCGIFHLGGEIGSLDSYKRLFPIRDDEIGPVDLYECLCMRVKCGAGRVYTSSHRGVVTSWER